MSKIQIFFKNYKHPIIFFPMTKNFLMNILILCAAASLCQAALNSEEINDFLKDFGKNKPMGYDVEHFTEKLLEEVMKLALRDTLLRSGNVTSVPTMKMVTSMDYKNLYDFFLKMNLSHPLTENDFQDMINKSLASKSHDQLPHKADEKNMDLFLTNLLKYIIQNNLGENEAISNPFKKKMYFYFFLVNKLKHSYLNQTTNISLASMLNTEKDMNLTEFIDYSLKFNSSDLPFSEYFDEENLKKPEYQDQHLKELSQMLHTYLKNGGKAVQAINSKEKTEGTDLFLIILIGAISIIILIIMGYFTKKYIKKRYESLNNEQGAASERIENIYSAKV